jgi:hypothetical protein
VLLNDVDGVTLDVLLSDVDGVTLDVLLNDTDGVTLDVQLSDTVDVTVGVRVNDSDVVLLDGEVLGVVDFVAVTLTDEVEVADGESDGHGLHGMHDASPESHHVPRAHLAASGLDDDDPAGHAKPALQLLHVVEPDTLNVPAGQIAPAGEADVEPAGHA